MLVTALVVLFISVMDYILDTRIWGLYVASSKKSVLNAAVLAAAIAPVVFMWSWGLLKNLRAEERLKRHLQLQTTVNRILTLSLEEMTLEEVLGNVLDLLLSVPILSLKPMGGIWLVEEDGVLSLKAHRGFPQGLLQACSSVPFGRCICGGTALSQKIEHRASVDGRHEVTYPEIREHGHYCVPLVYGGKTLGVINLYLEEGHPEDEKETEFLSSIAGILSGVIVRKQATGHVKYRLRLERAIARASGLIISGADEDITDALMVVGMAVSADRAYIFRITDQGRTMDCTHEWCASGVKHYIDDLRAVDASRFPWFMERLNSFFTVRVADVEEMPTEAEAEKEECGREGIKAILLMPIKAKSGDLCGFLGFDDTGGKRPWSEDDISMLRIVSEIFANHLERRKDEETIREMAYFDYLTGLPNRRFLLDRLGEDILRCKWKKRFFAVLFIDLDRFKYINDTFGHGFGDHVLKEIGTRLKSCLFEGDTVARPEQDTVARIGGDEFTVLLNEINRPEDVVNVIKKLSSALSTPIRAEGQDVYVTASMGISIYPYDGQHPEELLSNADTAMYRAKEDGGNTYRIYRPVMNEKALKFLQLEGMMRKGLEKDEFILHYQPQVNLKTGAITGVEALVRWQAGSSEFISPMDFIPIAEETGLIVEIGERVLRKACEMGKKIMATGHRVTMAVNISSRQFRQTNFSSIVEKALKETGFDPSLLELELTESIIMENSEEIINKMEDLRKAGIRFSIDDFGTGFSSLGYLKRLPIAMLKIDRSFIQNITESIDDASIAIAIIRLAHSLKLVVIAEGVETREQLKFLKGLECDMMQGFLFSRPVSGKDVLSLIERGEDLRLE